MKRAIAAVLALAALGVSVLPWESEARDRRCRPARNGGRTGDCVSYAVFEFAPSSGAGMAGPCSTTAPTGARGEALTFTRSSTAYCTKTASGGLATTGIADGDLVSVSNNIARQEYDSQGVLGLRVEGARTNSALYSQQIDNAAYVPFAEGAAAAPTKGTPNTGVAPDGTTSADPISFAATGTSQTSAIYVSIGNLTAQATSSVYLKAVSGTCTIDVCEEWNGPVNTSCVSVSINSTSWVRGVVTGQSTAGTSRYVIVGNSTNRNGGTVRGACTAYVWQVDYQSGTYATSPILTTTAAATRQPETPRFVISGLDPSAAGCMFANLDYSNNARWEGVSTQDSAAMNLTATHDTIGRLALLNGWTAFAAFGGATTASQTVNYNGNNRLGLRWTGTNVTSVFAGATATGTWTAPASNMNTLQIGSYSSAGRQVNTVMSRFQVDPDSTRCGQ